MSITDLESKLHEQIKKLVSEHLAGFEQEVADARQTIEQAIQSGFARLTESAAKGLNNLAEDNSIKALARETTTEAESALIAAKAEAKQAVNLAPLKTAFHEIQSKRTQADALSALVQQASGFAPRVVLFIVKGGNAVAWAVRGFADEQNEAIRGFTLSLQSNTVLRSALGLQQVFSGGPESQSDNNLLFEKFIITPLQIACVPLIVRNKAAAVLYSDSGSLDSDTINIDAIEILVGIAATAIELISVRPRTAEATAASLSKSSAGRALQISTPGQPVAQAVQPSPPPAPEPALPPPAPEPAPAEEPPQAIESRPAFFDAPSTIPTPSIEQIQAAASDGNSISETQSPAALFTPPAEVSYFEAAPAQPFTPPVDFSKVEVAPAQPSAPPVDFSNFEAAPVQPSAPPPETSGFESASAQQVEPPVPENEEQQKQHNDARRFARLLVSEIKLYNEQKVLDGRKNGDLYDRLKEDIDRSRQMYDKRVSATVASKFDYFYDELVNTLAEGDVQKLGRDCPGPSLTVS